MPFYPHFHFTSLDFTTRILLLILIRSQALLPLTTQLITTTLVTNPNQRSPQLVLAFLDPESRELDNSCSSSCK